MLEGLAIRAAIPQDEEQVAALWRACDLVTNYNDPGADFRFALGRNSSDILVGVALDGRVCGSAMVGHDGHRGWIYYVAAHPDLRKQGIGKNMVEAAEAWLRQRSVRKAMLLVRDTNTQVVEFYDRIGYKSVPRTVMEKWL